MNWNPYKRIADLERKVSEMHYELLQLAASNSSRLRKLEHKRGRESVLADFKGTAHIGVRDDGTGLRKAGKVV
jgi:hypothetical protein